jgi:hypothetical protein
MNMHTRNLVLAVGAAFAALSAARARAEIVELTNGHVMQGKVLDGRTDDTGLALELFDTNGVVIVKWDHIIESRRKELRLEHGIDLPEETVELVHGHRFLLTSGQVVEGVAENPREMDKPLRLKTRTGVKEYDRSSIAGKVEDADIDGLLVYDVEALYQQIRDEKPPETPAAHKALAQRCMNIGAYEHAKEHLLACKADDAFMQTSEGKAVEQMLRNAEVMIKAKGAQDMKQQVIIAEHDNNWNGARDLVKAIDEKYKDDVIRKAIGFDLLAARCAKGRDQYFQRAVALDVFKVMEKLIEDKAREKVPPLSSTEAPKSGAAGAGTLSAARNWANKDLVKALWDRVAGDMKLEAEELKNYWEHRTVTSARIAKYGTGSFIVVKKAASGPKGGGGGAPDAPKRRPPGQSGGSSGKGGKSNVPTPQKAADKPLTDEEWWESVGPTDRTRWLMAYFVETSGYFTILRTEQTPCPGCGGLGFNKSTASNGDEEQHFCVQCNGIGVFKSVTFK